MSEKKFYNMSRQERLDRLFLSPEIRQELENIALSEDIASHLIENQISEIEIPMGLCFLTLDGKDYTVPMATEEPSVIAAANNGAKLAGNFQILENTRLMNGQIVFYEVENSRALIEEITARQPEIFELAESSYPSIYQRGGGLQRMSLSSHEQFLSADFFFDSCDAMGANMINTVLEAIADYFRKNFPKNKILFSILSNFNPQTVTVLETRISLSEIGESTAQKIILASDYAGLDPFRTATHNKGVMNGIAAVILATGNDLRAINASAYSFANGESFTEWYLENESLVGKIKISLPLASAGGGTHVLPKARIAHEILGRPDAKKLAAITAAVGLANNLAALKALVGPGIQKGHMFLQARSLAISVGAKAEEIDQLAEVLRRSEKMNSETARILLQEIKKKSSK